MTGRTRAAAPLLAMVTVLLVAANLRAAITSVGPVLDLIGVGAGLSSTALGVLGAVPLLTFAAVSPAVHLLSRRVGVERAVLVALITLMIGTIVRSLPGPNVSLWLGTVLLGASIAVGNVLLPVIVKTGFPNRVAVLTGVYTSVMSGVAALASGVSVALAGLGGWRLALGIWAALGVPAVLLWAPRLRAAATDTAPPPGAGAGASMWTAPVAWYVALFMALQSTSFYLLITWLPSIEAGHGVSASTAGWHLFGFQLVGIVAGLATGPVIRRRRDQRAIGVVLSALMVIAMTGLLLAPGAVLLWVTFAGISAGGAIVLALTLIGLRTRTAGDTGRLSGMAQGVGYLVAAGGPVGVGALHDRTGGWTWPLLAEISVAVVQLFVALLVGRDRFTHDPVSPDPISPAPVSPAPISPAPISPYPGRSRSVIRATGAAEDPRRGGAAQEPA
jgi:MFS transporter, CP family, cyanate transporter